MGRKQTNIEENLLGDKVFLGNRVQVAEGGFTVLNIIVEYLQLLFGLGFYHYVFETLFSFM